MGQRLSKEPTRGQPAHWRQGRLMDDDALLTASNACSKLDEFADIDSQCQALSLRGLRIARCELVTLSKLAHFALESWCQSLALSQTPIRDSPTRLVPSIPCSFGSRDTLEPAVCTLQRSCRGGIDF